MLRTFDVGNAEKVSAFCEPSAAELARTDAGGVDGTGHAVWLAAYPLCAYLVGGEGQQLCATSARRVIELGAGVGLPGLIAGKCADVVVFTDSQPAVVSQLSRTIDVNRRTGHFAAHTFAAPRLLDWAEDLPFDVAPNSFSLVIACDCIYYEGSETALLNAAKALLAEDGVVLLSYTSRWPSVDRSAAAALRRSGLAWRCARGMHSYAHASGREVFIYEGRKRMAGVEEPRLAPLVESETGIVRLRALGALTAGAHDLAALERLPLRPKGLCCERHWFGDDKPSVNAFANLVRTWCPAVEVLRVASNALGGAHVPRLCDALGACAYLRELSLDDNGLDDDDACLLARGLCAARPPLHSLSVASNRIRGTGLRALCLSLSPGASAVSLRVDHNLLDQDTVGTVADVIPPSSTVELSIGSQWLGDEGASQLAARALQRCTRLKRLDVRHATSAWGALRMVQALCERQPSQLATLVVRGNLLGDEEVRSLALLVGGETVPITDLDLSANRISWEGAEALAEHLPWRQMVRLVLDENTAIGDDGVDAISDAIAEHGCPAKLGLRLVGSGDDGALALARALGSARAGRAVQLDFRGNDLTMGGTLSLLQELRHILGASQKSLIFDLRGSPPANMNGGPAGQLATALLALPSHVTTCLDDDDGFGWSY